MNRLILFLILLGFWGCDTSKNITPLGKDYFIKFYGAIGYQQGVALQSTPDGGFIIAGNSRAKVGSQSDYLLIKVDALGNQEWLQTYDFNGTGENDNLTDVLVDANGIVIAGTSQINGVGKIVLMRVDMLGISLNENIIVDKNSTDSYICNGISKTSNGEFLVVGPVINGVQKGKSVISVINDNLTIEQPNFKPDTLNSGDELVYVKALQVANHLNIPKSDSIHYLIFGYSNSGTETDLVLYQFNTLFNTVNISEKRNFLNTKTVDVIKISDNNYTILAASNDVTYLVNISEKNAGYALGAGQSIKSNQLFKGVSLQKAQDGQYLISSIITEQNPTNTLASVVETSALGSKNWQRIFGTDFPYTSGKLITLTDGSVVFTGTAGFKGQTKVFLIKLKNNGEMK